MTKLTNASKGWTEEDMAELISLFNRQHGLQSIALALGRSGSAVVAKLVQIRLLGCNPSGNYFLMPTEPWVMWQEVKQVDTFMKTEEPE